MIIDMNDMKIHTRRISRLLLIALFVWVGDATVYGQRIISKKYTMEEGLPSNRIYKILQDSCGFIWFGTDDGLSRFDGVEFKNYRFSHRPGSILSNSIHNLFIDSQQKMWIALDNGINIYDPLSDTFRPFVTASGKSLTCRVTDIVEDRDGEMWFATNGHGVYRYNPATDSLYSYCRDNHKSIHFYTAMDIHEDSRGYIWIGTYAEGLTCYDKKTDSFTTYTQGDGVHNLSDNSIHKIYEDSYGNLWIGTFQNGLDRFDYKTRRFSNYRDRSIENLLYHIHDVVEYRPGELIVASDNGIGLFKVEEGRIIPTAQSPLKAASIANKFIYCLFIDAEESIWLGSYFNGVDFYSDLQNNFEYFSCATSEASKEGKVINVIKWDRFNGLYWIGTDDNGLFRFDPRTQTVTPYRTAKDIGSTYYCVHDMLFDNARLFVATYERGLEVFDMRTKKIKSYLHNPANPKSLPSSRLFAIYKASNGQIYIGTSKGLCYYDRGDDSFVRIGAIKTRVSSIIEDANGKIWIATSENGLYSYDQRTTHVRLYQYDASDTTSLLRNTLTTMAIDRKKRLWIGTYGYGICRYDEESDAFIRYENLDLPNHIIASIIPDGDNLWLSTNKGLVYCNPDSGYVKTYSKSNGLYNEQFSLGAGLKSNDGKIFLGSVDGFCVFAPSNLVDNAYNPNVLITDMTIFGKSVTSCTENSPLRNSIEHTRHVTLDSRQSVIGFNFAALSYIAPEENRYRYKLEGFDKEWRMAKGSNPHASYTNLPAGEYTFHVQGTNSEKIWSPHEVVLQITILPPFFKSKLAYGLYTVVGAVGAVLLILYSVKSSNKKQQEKIAKINAEKEKELYDSKMEFFTNIAHEIRTPLILIIGPLEVLMKSKSLNERYGDYLSIIEQNYKRLYSLVSELLDYRKIDSGMYKLSYSVCNLRNLVEKIVSRFEWTARQKGITLEIDIPENLNWVLDCEAMTKIVSNLITNGLKYAKSRITVSAYEVGDSVCIEVTDDGEGIPDAEKKRVFEAFYQVRNHKGTANLGIGIGLHMTYSFVKMMGGEIKALDRRDGESGLLMFIRLPRRSESEAVERSTGSMENTFILKEPEADIDSIQDKMDEEAVVADKDKKYTVLIVDDNAEVLDFLSKILSQEYFVISALNGAEALNILQNNQVDMIVSDVMMEEMDGFEFCKRVKADLNTSHIPIVLLTAKTDTASKIEGLELGIEAYIEKPFSPLHLQAQLKNLLKRRSELKEKYTSTPLTEIHTAVLNKLDEEFVNTCTSIITQNLSEPEFTVDKLAKELGMSRTNVFSKIKAIVGMTPNDFIKLIRLKTACKMMVESDYRITEIGFLVGFSSSSYFAKCFQKQFGMNPTEFMKKLKSGELTDVSTKSSPENKEE